MGICWILLVLIASSFAAATLHQPPTTSAASNSTVAAAGDNEGEDSHDSGVVSVDHIFGSNAQFFTVCRSLTCCDRTLRLPAHAGKLMLFIPTIHVDGDSYLSYYLGLVFDTFLLEKGGGAHILVLSLSHGMAGGPYADNLAVKLVGACNQADFSVFTRENCTEFTQLLEQAAMFSHLGGLHHRNLALVVLNDAIITTAYTEIAHHYYSLHNSSLFAIIHLNHEQPWLDNQRQSTESIQASYRETRLVFRTHYFSDFVAPEGGGAGSDSGSDSSSSAANVHYLPLGPGLLQTERMALGLRPEQSRFPSAAELPAPGPPPSRRAWLCSFAGSMVYKFRGNTVESSRADMVHTLRDVPGCAFFPTDDVSKSAPLTQRQYMQLAHSSLFSLCPRGVGPETNRPHQVSQWGCLYFYFVFYL
jgi:hypothetical protein